eukprot:INCI9801.1.p1 GENE.INCI9801.1~~INCI9801.1.p1  ORF type:complete len:152 (-),score=8.32 INCI9801.1:110-565(-)
MSGATATGGAVLHRDEEHVSSTSKLLIELTKRLLNSISNRHFEEYERLCSDSLTAFEPEACGHLIHGLKFHQHYFDCPSGPPDHPPPKVNVTIVNPHVRLCGLEVGVVSYVRVTQRGFQTTRSEETRVWQKIDGHWVHVHFHRSSPATSYS